MGLLGLASRGPKSKFGRSRSSNLSRRERYVRADARQLVYESLESRQLMAGLPELIELAFDSSSISQITSVGSDVYFVASTQDKGIELWKVDMVPRQERQSSKIFVPAAVALIRVS